MRISKTNRICLVPYVPHLEHLYKALIDNRAVNIYAFSRCSKSSKLYDYKNVIPLFKGMIPFNTTNIFTTIGIATQLPLFINSFSKTVLATNSDSLIIFDFYHWYTLQAIHYKKKHPEVKFIIYSETKRWPRNWLSRVVMRCFLAYVRRHNLLVDGVLVYTEEGKRWWQEYAQEVKRVTVLPAPVDVEVFKPVSNRTWLPDNTLRILMNARYSPYKRHEDLLQAVSQLVAEGWKLQVTLIGRGDSGFGRVQELVKRYELTEQVTFLDPLPMEKMPELYQDYDVLVLPSYNEAIGMVVPEAMACGLPTVTSDTVGANVYVRSNETGFVFETGNVEALKVSLRQCFNPNKLAAMSEAGCTRMTTKFTPAQVARQFIDFLQKLS